MFYDTHMHTPLCKHARGEPEEYAAMAAKRGLDGIIITCHNPGPEGFSTQVRMSLAQFDDYVALVDRARQAWHGRIDVRLGLECDYLPEPEMEAFLHRLLHRADFHYVLGSLHPQLPYYRQRYDTGDAHAFYRTYYDHLAQAAESGLFDCLAHPDLVKNTYVQEWKVDAILDDIRASLDRIAQTGVAMELNTSGIHKTIREMNPGPQILAEMRARGIPVVVGSDAHEPGRVAADFGRAFAMLAAAGYTETHYFLGRQRHRATLADLSYRVI